MNDCCSLSNYEKLQEIFSQLKIDVTTPMRCISKFTSYVTKVSNFFIIIIKRSFTNPASVSWLKLFFFFTHDQIFVKVFFHYLFAVIVVFKNCFNKFISNIFTSKNNNRFTKSIINTNNFVRKNATGVILIFFFEQEPS